MFSINAYSGSRVGASVARRLTLLLALAILTTAFVGIGSMTHPVSAQAASGPVSVKIKWWGALVSLDRTTGCFAAHGVPAAGDLILLSVPPPWGTLTLAAVKAHKAWIASQMGTNGVNLHLNWGGFVHSIKPRGDRLNC